MHSDETTENCKFPIVTAYILCYYASMKAVTKKTINEIAQIAGVSIATVSRVINQSDNVRPKTREKVLKVIDEYNYIPSETARGLSKGNSDVIGIVCPDLENPFFYGMIKGMTNIAEKNHYHVLMFYTDENVEKEKEILRIAKGRDLAGLVITPVGVADEETAQILDSYEEEGIPVVLLDRELKHKKFCSVQADNEDGSYQAISALIREGHTRIALIAGKDTVSAVHERALGFRRAMKEHDIPIREEYMIYGDSMSAKAYEGMKRLLDLQEPPTAVFTTNNMATLGALRALTERHLQIGRDIAIIGFDDIPILRSIDYHLSVVDRSEEELGEKAMHAMMLRLQGSEKEAYGIGRVPAHLILRGSERMPDLNRQAV